MRAATARALDRHARMTRRMAACEGLEAVADAINHYERDDRELTFDAAARIAVALGNSRIRDHAWHRIIDPAPTNAIVKLTGRISGVAE